MSRKLKVESLKLKTNPKGGERIMRMLLALGLVVLVGGLAYAVTTDSVYLTVTPKYNLSVNISSTSHTFGSAVDIGSSVTICIGQIENDGNITTKWQKKSANTSGGWTLVTSGTPGADSFRLLAITTGTALSPTIIGGNPGTGCIDGTHDSGQLGVTSAGLTDLIEGGAASPTHPRLETRKLWASIMMPTNILSAGAGNEQTITLSIQAIQP